MIYAIIPARYASTRFPGKPLAMIDGKTMIQRVYEQTLKARLIDKILVATDDERIECHVKSFGGNVVMTSIDHQSGTDRLAEVVLADDSIEIVVNVQGDEPIIAAGCIDMVVEPLINCPDVVMSTLIRKNSLLEDLTNPNIVKVVVDKDNFALYFSRSCIPFIRNEGHTDHYLHIGIYAYKRDTLIKLSDQDPVPLEQTEGLEQLRALYSGIKIKTVLTSYNPISVDVAEDIIKVEEHLKKSRSLLAGSDGVI